MTGEPPLTTARALAETYDGPTRPWERVQEYRGVLEYQSLHPDKGSQAIASALDLPRGRIRPWLDGGMPDVVRGIETAEAHGWLDLHADDSVFYGLNQLVAWIYSGGAISEAWYKPYFTVDDAAARNRLERAAARANVVLRVSREDEPGRADELVPIDGASVLGRVLSTLDAPVGEKVTIQRLPRYLDDAPDFIRSAFAKIYFVNRAVDHPDRGLWQIKEDRPAQYIASLACLFRDVLDTRIESSANHIRIWADDFEEADR